MRLSYKSLDKLSLGNLILVLEADLDSIQLQLQPRYNKGKKPFPRNIKRIRRQVQRCLAVARRLQKRFPQSDYTLNRCHYLDELPNKPMSFEKKNWYKFKRLQNTKQETLTERTFLRVTPQMLKEIDKEAKIKDISRNALIRDTILNAL